MYTSVDILRLYIFGFRVRSISFSSAHSSENGFEIEFICVLDNLYNSIKNQVLCSQGLQCNRKFRLYKQPLQQKSNFRLQQHLTYLVIANYITSYYNTTAEV